MTDLYDLLPGFAAVFEKLEDEEPGLGDAEHYIAGELDAADVAHDVRCEQSIRYLRNLDSRRAVLVAELDRLKAKLNAVDNRRESVRNYLRSVMVLMGSRKVKTTIATASLSAGRERIVVDEENITRHLPNWPTDVVARTVVFPPPKVNKTALARLDPTELRGLPGISVECGEDVLTIR
jgi:uncharacterized small protein (DUF1192 family)